MSKTSKTTKTSARNTKSPFTHSQLKDAETTESFDISGAADTGLKLLATAALGTYLYKTFTSDK